MQRSVKVSEDGFIDLLSRISLTDIKKTNIERNLSEASDYFGIQNNYNYHLGFSKQENPSQLKTDCIACCEQYIPGKLCVRRYMNDGTFSLNR